jgi:hypothetical protein
MLLLLTAVGLKRSGSSAVYIHTQTVHRIQRKYKEYFANSLWGGINSKMEKVTCCLHLIFLWLINVGMQQTMGEREMVTILDGECQGKRTLGRSKRR